MSQRAARIFNGKWRVLALGMALVGFGAATTLPAPAALAAAYSCGSYSSGTYSSSSTCADDAPGTNTGGNTDGVGAPNTGFARLMEPANLTAIIGSLALIVVGIVLMMRSRSRKKQGVSFRS